MVATERGVVISVTTYRRADRLGPLLAAVTAQFPDATGHPLRMIVIDNDADQSARPVAEHHGWEYVVEPHPGIGAARHRALAQGRERDLVIMLDDDLTPEPGWLRGLLVAWREYRPSIVMGFVRYVWPEDSDPWIVAGGFFRRTPQPRGTVLTGLATGNVLIDAADVAARGVQFDRDLGFTGGEDTAFGDAVLAAGGTIIGTDESVAREVIPPERTTRDFVRRRTISHGEQRSVQKWASRRGARRFVARGVALAGGATRWVIFFGAHLVGKLRGNLAQDAGYHRRSWFALGRMRGAVGRQHHEYARSS